MDIESIPFRARFDPGVSDEHIARIGDDLVDIVVTSDKDFKRTMSRVPIGRRAQFRRLGRISLDCRSGSVLRRVEALMHYIEFGYADALASRDYRLIVEISETSIRFVR